MEYPDDGPPPGMNSDFNDGLQPVSDTEAFNNDIQPAAEHQFFFNDDTVAPGAWFIDDGLQPGTDIDFNYSLPPVANAEAFNDGLAPAADTNSVNTGQTQFTDAWHLPQEVEDHNDANRLYDGTSSSSSCDSSSADEWGESAEGNHGQPAAQALASYEEWLAAQPIVESARLDMNANQRSEIRAARDKRREVKFAHHYNQEGGDRKRAEHKAAAKLRRYHRDARKTRAPRTSGHGDEATRDRRAARRAARRQERRWNDCYIDEEGNWQQVRPDNPRYGPRDRTRDARRANIYPDGDHHPQTIDSPQAQTGPQPQIPQQGQHGYFPQNPSQPQFDQPTQQHGLGQHDGPPPNQPHGGFASGSQQPDAPPEQQGSKRKRESSHNSSEDAEGETDPESDAPEAKRQQTSTSAPRSSQPGITTTGPARPAQALSASQHGSAASAADLADATSASGLALSSNAGPTVLTGDQLNEHAMEIDALFGDSPPGQGAILSPPTGQSDPSSQQTDDGLEADFKMAWEETQNPGTDPVQPLHGQGQTVDPQNLTANPQNPKFQNQQSPGQGRGPPVSNPSGPAVPGPPPPQQAPGPVPPPPAGKGGAGGSADSDNPPAQAEEGSNGRGGNTGSGQGGRGGTGRGAADAGGGKRTHKQRKSIPLGEGAGGWKENSPVQHPRTGGLYSQAQQQGALLPEAHRAALEKSVISNLDAQQVIADKMIQQNSGRATKQTVARTAPIQVLREAYPTTEESERCKRCLDQGIECNIRQAGGKECDNCTNYRHDAAYWPQSIDHDCMFQQIENHPLVAAERKVPANGVVNFVHPELWQCGWCAQEGRYCDADRLMSVRCTACASLGRDCTVRQSPALRERDYLRAHERGFRIMCRLCCKAGKQCSWTDSTTNYGSGKPCKQCEPMEKDKQRRGACTTFSRLPPSAASGIWNPLPLANVLPAVDLRGDPLFIRQRQPWRSQIDMLDNAKVRHQGNGMKLVFPDDKPGDRTGRRSCEFCFYTATECHFLGSDAESACKTCTYIGIKCMNRGGREMPGGQIARVPWPPYNLANSTGYHARAGEWVSYYTHCNRCVQAKRPCDRKRPCESCREHKLDCEPAAWGNGIFVADRHIGDRSGNYYMALGHGPEGLGTEMVMRDPTRMACGPKTPLKHWKTPKENAEKEETRAHRCAERENALRWEAGYQAPGLGWFPPSLAVSYEYDDPTEPPGWPGSYIRNDREPIESRKTPEFRAHPPGVANYPADDAPGIGEGGPPPAGGEVQAPPAHHEHGGILPELLPLAAELGYNVNLTGHGHNPTGAYQEAPANGAGGQVNNPTIGGNDPGHQGYQPQAQDGAGRLVNNPHSAAHNLMMGINFTITDNIYDADDTGHQGHQKQAQDPPLQGQQSQALPAHDEVLEDAVSQGNHAGSGGHGDDTAQEDPPPGMNAFVPLQEEPEGVPLNTDTCDVPDNLLKPFKLGAKFAGVERFLSWKDTNSPLTEDGTVTAPALGARSRQPDTTFLWGKPPAFGKVSKGDTRAFAVMRIHRPGNNVLRDIPDRAPMNCQNDERPCKDHRAPEGDKCEATDRYGKCENMRHAQKGDKIFPVCADCDLASKTHLWTTDEGGAGLTNREILNMRAYFCDSCSEAAVKPESWEGRGFDVYGFSADATQGVDVSREVTVNGVVERQGGWRDEKALPITGCNCARKLMGRVLCSYHRLFLAQKMARQAALMQEWRFRRYKEEKVCPMCLEQPGLDSTKAKQADGQRFWNCLVCNGMVVASQREGPHKRCIEVESVVRKKWYREQVPEELRNIGDPDYSIGHWETDFRTAETVEEEDEEMEKDKEAAGR